MRPRFAVLLLLSLLLVDLAQAAPRAVVVVGLASSELQSQRFQQAAAVTRDGLLARGVPEASIAMLGVPASARARRDAVLGALAPMPGATANDETWIVLIGSASMRADQPAFQVSGPRLSAQDLTDAVAALPGRKLVVIASSAGGAFLPPLLALPEVEALSATGDAGEINEPRFIELWPQVLAANPEASFAQIAAKSSELVAQFYEQASLALGEHARLIDRASGTILKAPFDSGRLASVSPAKTGRRPEEGYSVANIEIPKPAGDLDIQRLPADPASLALIAEARAAAEKTPHAALILRSETDMAVDGTFDTRETRRTRAFIRTGEALDDIATIRLPGTSASRISRLTGARVVKPDGSQLLVNLATLADDARKDAKADNEQTPEAPSAPPFIELPEVVPGSVVEVAWTVEAKHQDSLPAFYDEWPLADDYPVLSARFAITHPDHDNWRAFAPNLPAPETSAKDGSRTTTWTLHDLAAREPLPGDPPARSFLPWIGLSSLAGWNDFADWYRRLASGSETPDSKVEALADEIAAAHPDRMGRIRAAYERVAALRYVAIELGVGAFRPRTPGKVWSQHYGDCKDKANLLVALLRRMGIEAEFVLVNRFGVTFTDFPGWQFNHAIARVPAAPADGQPHALWLDSTDRLVPFGVIAPGDLGRQGLVFSPGFKSAAFHEITGEQEPESRWIEKWELAKNNHATLDIRATGSAEVRLRHLMLGASPTARRLILGSLLKSVSAQILSIETPDPYDLSQPYAIHAEMVIPAGYPPTFPMIPGFAEIMSLGTIERPIYWDEGRAFTIMRYFPSHLNGAGLAGISIPSGPITPTDYQKLREYWFNTFKSGPAPQLPAGLIE